MEHLGRLDVAAKTDEYDDKLNPVFEIEDDTPAPSYRPPSSSMTGAMAEFLRGTKDTVTLRDQKCIMSMFMLAALMDGDLNRTELRMWQSMCELVGPAVAVYRQDRIEFLCDRYRECAFISAKDIHDTFDPQAVVEVPASSRLRIIWWWLTRLLNCG